MRVIMTTDNLPESEKFPSWRDFICDYYHESGIFGSSDRFFKAEISEANLGDLTVSLAQASAHSVNNLKCQKPKSNKRKIFILQQLNGTSSFEQDGRRATLGPNDILCFDNARPLSVVAEAAYKHLLLHIPYDLWNQKFGPSEQVTACVLKAGRGFGPLLTNLFRQIPLLEEDDDFATISRFEDAILSLIAATYSGLVFNRRPRQGSGRTALLYRAKMFIENNLHDPELNRKKIAISLGISESYLQSLFRDANQSVDKWLWEMRLEKCRRDIADPLLLGKGLSEIAFASGFSSFPHFSRKFKEAFNVTASEYRHEQHRHGCQN